MSHLYISHSSKNLDALLEVHEAMRAASIPDWYDAGKGERGEMNRAIDNAFAMLVLVSASSVRSGAVKKDIERAKARGLTLIPFQIDKGRLNGFFKKEIAPHMELSHTSENALTRLVDKAQAAYKRKCPVIAVMNLKGGIGKTTVSSQVFGTWQSAVGGRVLLVDLDPQYNLTQTFLPMDTADESAATDRSVISLFEKSRLHAKDAKSPAEDWTKLSVEPFAPAPHGAFAHDLMQGDGPGGRLDLITGQFEISKYAFATDAAALATVKANFLRMVDHYRSEYDLIVFDTNPNATFLTRCALEVADRVLAPMHPDVYSLRGVKLLNQVIREQVSEDKRPALSVLFNAVGRSEQSNFEADARNGLFDETVGFPLSKALMRSALPRSGHLVVRSPEEGQAPWKQLVIHNGRGGGLKAIRESLKAVSYELAELVKA